MLLEQTQTPSVSAYEAAVMSEPAELETTLTILMPVFNEARTIQEIIKRVWAAPLNGTDKELIIVDDGSTDGTREALQRMSPKEKQRIFFHAQNMGKGAALRTALTYATGDIIIVQD